jgi:hypothetical protein
MSRPHTYPPPELPPLPVENGFRRQRRPTGEFVKKHWGTFVAVGGVVVAVLGFIGGTVWKARGIFDGTASKEEMKAAIVEHQHPMLTASANAEARRVDELADDVDDVKEMVDWNNDVVAAIAGKLRVALPPPPKLAKERR